MVDKTRTRRTAAQIEQLSNQIIEALEQDHPMAIRHIFYLMTNPRLPESVPKTDKGIPNGYRIIQNRLTRMRRKGLIPYGWITDATRRGHHVYTYNGHKDFLRQVAGLYRADLWRQAGHYVEVWCESRSIAGVIEDDCRELAVSLYPAGGFSSITLAYQAAEQINFAAAVKPAEIIYIGDYDPAGVLIDNSTEKELRRHLDPDVELNFHRIAITPEQIEKYDLPTKPRKKKDKRSKHIKETVEAEAMPPKILRGILREKVESFLPPRALKIAKVAEESERQTLDARGHDHDIGAVDFPIGVRAFEFCVESFDRP